MRERKKTKMESNKKMAEKSNRRGVVKRSRKLTYKHNTVNAIIRTITKKLPGGNAFYHTSRVQNLQHIIQYVTYLERSIDQVSREKNLSLEFDYKILTKDYVSPRESDDHVENVIDNSSSPSTCTSTATTTSGYVSDDSKYGN